MLRRQNDRAKRNATRVARDHGPDAADELLTPQKASKAAGVTAASRTATFATDGRSELGERPSQPRREAVALGAVVLGEENHEEAMEQLAQRAG